MNYQKISGPMVFQPTGWIGNCEAQLKSGKRLLDEFDGVPLDAPEAIPAGATKRIEWFNQQGICVWFDAQVIALRSYQ